MTKNNPLERLMSAKVKANSDDADRRNYQSFITAMRDDGWTDSDVAEYAENIKVLMGKDDDKAMELFPHGLYANATEARQMAREFWKGYAA